MTQPQPSFPLLHHPLIRFYGTLIGILSILASPATASPVAPLAPPSQGLGLLAQATTAPMIWINPRTGIDQPNSGTAQAPLKTITYALRFAQPGTVIQLSPGTYSAQSGEQFPLILRPGVSLQGNPQAKGQGIAIEGGGFFLSRTSARQDIAILAASQSTITGVTVSNTNPRGYGIWVESSAPTIRSNTFTRNTHDGISVVGSGTPLIENNIFSQNGANGITAFGTSQAVIQNNLFENTGFAINIAGKASPQINQNLIRLNKDGVVIQGSSQPTLRGNTIEQSQRDGVVAIAQAMPNLGTSSQPGNNVFKSNGRFDVNNSTRITVPAYGNQWFTNRLNGAVSLAGTTSPALPGVSPLRAPLPLPPTPRAVPSYPSYPSYPAPSTTPRKPSLPPLSNASTKFTPAVASLPRASGLPPVPSLPPVPGLSPMAYGSPVPPPINPSRSTGLPVPSVPPVGNGSVINFADVAPPPSISNALRYRVVVSADSSEVQDQVRQLVPGSFRTRAGGHILMQAGAFSDRTKADDLAQQLLNNGLQASVETFN